jgi:hypothetical protein
MEKKQVWEVMKKEDIPQDRRTIKCNWIFKIKRNGVFRARLVACGYSQIPGVNFNKSLFFYMNVHKGMDQDDNTCLLLKKTIYGLVQSAREFYNKLLSILHGIHREQI